MAEIVAEKWRKNGKVGAGDKGNANMVFLYRPKLG